MTRRQNLRPNCECGCGGTPAKGLFLPGHDQRLRSRLEERVGGLLALRNLVDHAEALVVGSMSADAFADRTRMLLGSDGGGSRGPMTSPTIVAEYMAGRLTFKRDVIEPLKEFDVFRVVTPHGTFQMTKADVYAAFPAVVRSRSYRDAGIYHYPRLPEAAKAFRVDD